MNFEDIRLFARLSGMTAEHIVELLDAGELEVDEADELIRSLDDATVFCGEPEDQELAIAAERLVLGFGDLFVDESA